MAPDSWHSETSDCLALVLMGVGPGHRRGSYGVRSLALCNGSYLSQSATTAAMFAGGLSAGRVAAARKRRGRKNRQRGVLGALYSSGLIAAGAFSGARTSSLSAGPGGFPSRPPLAHPFLVSLARRLFSFGPKSLDHLRPATFWRFIVALLAASALSTSRTKLES